MTIIDDYDSAAVRYEAFTNKLEALITDLIKIDGVKVHAISSRLKSRSSLESNISNNVDKYTALTEITDLSGVRIITYFEDDVSKVSDILEREFEIDGANSSNKRD